MNKTDTMTIRTVDAGGAISRLKAQQLARMIVAFYENPENLRRFEEWKKQKEKDKTTEEELTC